jgi:hypothetical protein
MRRAPRAPRHHAPTAVVRFRRLAARQISAAAWFTPLAPPRNTADVPVWRGGHHGGLACGVGRK